MRSSSRKARCRSWVSRTPNALAAVSTIPSSFVADFCVNDTDCQQWSQCDNGTCDCPEFFNGTFCENLILPKGLQRKHQILFNLGMYATTHAVLHTYIAECFHGTACCPGTQMNMCFWTECFNGAVCEISERTGQPACQCDPEFGGDDCSIGARRNMHEGSAIINN